MNINRQEKKIIGIIPARFASTRFPGKPLSLIKGKPMIQWVYEACADVFDELYIASDDLRVEKAAIGFGANIIITRSDHRSGTDRIGEALKIIEAKTSEKIDIVVNIQGDEPLIKAEQLHELISCFEDANTQIATLIKQFEENENPENPNIVKVVCDKNMRALYFSRHAIPYSRNKDTIHHKHIGLYAYRSDILKEICSLRPTEAELAESLEQLRWLEHGYSIQAKITQHNNIGVDMPEDIKKIEALLS